MVQDYANVPASIRQIHRPVRIVGNVIYVNSLIFLVMVSKSLKYMTSMYIKIQKKPQLVSVTTKVIQVYTKYGFVVNFINYDE